VRVYANAAKRVVAPIVGNLKSKDYISSTY
jgi:hypothetical protein